MYRLFKNLAVLVSMVIALIDFANAADFNVQPLYFDFVKKKGTSREPFTIKLSSTGKAVLTISTFRAKQDTETL